MGREGEGNSRVASLLRLGFPKLTILLSLVVASLAAGEEGVRRSQQPSSSVMLYGYVSPFLFAQAPVPPPDDDYRYDARGRRDPFESLIKEKPPAELQSLVRAPVRPRGPLERYDLSALQLVGILWGELGRRGLIKSPDGKGYFVTVGTYMGENSGKVVAIEENHLVLEEQFVDLEGNIVRKPLTIPLRRKEKEAQ